MTELPTETEIANDPRQAMREVDEFVVGRIAKVQQALVDLTMAMRIAQRAARAISQQTATKQS